MTENEQRLQRLLSGISPLYEAPMREAQARQDALAKPPGSLGLLEDISVQLAGITGQVHNKMEKTHLLVFAADNGVVAEGVSSAPQSVTLMQTVNLTRGKTGASVLAKHFGSGIIVCDVGVNADIKEKAVLNRKIAYGTQNIASGPAMTRQQAPAPSSPPIRLPTPSAWGKWASATPLRPPPFWRCCFRRRWRPSPEEAAA